MPAGGAMPSNKASRPFAAAMVAGLAVAWCTSGASAQSEPGMPAKDYNQRSLEVYEFRKAASHGPERGREIFYYKCWFCHNEYTKDIPKLPGLYRHPALLSGEPVNDETVSQDSQWRAGHGGLQVHLERCRPG
jgi:hypothetical protein